MGRIFSRLMRVFGIPQARRQLGRQKNPEAFASGLVICWIRMNGQPPSELARVVMRIIILGPLIGISSGRNSIADWGEVKTRLYRFNLDILPPTVYIPPRPSAAVDSQHKD